MQNSLPSWGLAASDKEAEERRILKIEQILVSSKGHPALRLAILSVTVYKASQSAEGGIRSR